MQTDLPRPAAVPLVPTKLFRPRGGPEVVTRDRLHRLLSGGTSARLILVSAAAGAGKTTLVAEWIERGRVPSAWLSLDPSDDHPDMFLRYVVEAVGTLSPGAEKRARALLELTPPPPPLAVMAALLAGLAGRGSRGILVLDDYHVLSSPEIHGAVTLMAERGPPGMTLVILTRSDPPLPLSRLRARGQLREVREADLRFRPDEAGPLLSRIAGSTPGEDAVIALVERTEGWAAGLQLAALALRQTDDPDGFVSGFSGTHAFVADYLADEVLAGIPDPLQAFMIRSSLLKRLTGPLCDAALDREGSGETLETLARANLFLVPLDGERRWYRYHHLFGDLLRRRLPAPLREEGPKTDLASGILERAARWCDAHGHVDDAIEYYIQAGAVDRAAGLVARHGVVTVSRGEVARVLRWLRLLPESLVRSSPDHSIIGAWAFSLLEDPGSMDVYAMAASEACASGVRPFPHVDDVEFHAAIARAEARAVLAGRPELALAEVEELRRSVPEESGALRTVANIVLGELLALMGRHEEALQAHREAHLVAMHEDLHLLQITSATGIAENLLVLGRVREVIAVVDRTAHGSAASGRVAASRRGNLWALKALAALEVDDLSAVTSSACGAWEGLGGNPDPDEGWRLAGRLARRAHPGMHSTGRGVLHTHLAQVGAWLRGGDLDRVQRRLAGLREEAPDPAPVVTALVDWIDVRLREARGDVRGLARWRPSAAGPTDSAFWRDVSALTSARAALAGRDHETASAVLDPLVEGLEARGPHLLHAPALLLRAELSAAQHRRKEARSRVVSALEITAPEGRTGPWVDARPAVLSVLEEVVGDGKASDGALNHAARVLARQAEMGRGLSGRGVRSSPPALSDRELAVLRLLVAGRTNREIASALFLAEGTVKKHTHNIYGKLGVRNRTEAVATAGEAGLLDE